MTIVRWGLLGMAFLLGACDRTGSTAEAATPVADDLETELRIGVVDGSPEYQFVSISRVDEGPEGEIFVLDSRAGAVRVYDSQGRHLRSFGRSGSGPGEFSSPMSLNVSGDTVLVLDRSLGRVAGVRVHLFTADGRHHKTFDAPVSNETINAATATPDGWIGVGTISFQAQGLASASRTSPLHEYLAARRIDLDANKIAAPHLRVEGTPYYLLGELGWIRSPLFAPKPAITPGPDGRVYVTAGGEYRIDIHAADGTLLESIEHEVQRIPVRDRDFDEALSAELKAIRSRPANPETDRLVAMLENDYPRLVRAEHRPITGRILVSPGGRIMIERLDRDPTPFVTEDGSSWDLLEADGSIVKEFELAATRNPLRLTDTHLYVREVDDLDVQYVTKLRLGF